MKLNGKKTKCMPFIFSLTKDFEPRLSLEDGKYLEVIYQMKLVGLVISSDMTWNGHVSYTVSRVNSIIWQLVRFKNLGAPQEKLITFYTLKVRSILMFGSVCYHSSLTQELSHTLELQQKKSLAVILGNQYKSYSNALSVTNLPRLAKLRETACLKWAVRAHKSPLHKDLFPLTTKTMETRSNNMFMEYRCKTNRFYNSAVPYMTRALNKYYHQE